nr:ABC transporter substrate-binding protein [Bradyrhizobium sp. BR 10289]
MSLAVVASGWPIEGRAAKPPVRIGFLCAGSATSQNSIDTIRTIKQSLSRQGLVESRDYEFEDRYAAGDYDRFPALARELSQAGVSIVLANTIASARAAQQLSPSVQVVMIGINNPVDVGLIASLARPGHNTTGMSVLAEDLTPKLLDLARELLPSAKSIAALFNPSNPSNPVLLERLQKAAGSAGMTVAAVELKSASGLETAFAGIAASRPDLLVLIPDLGTTVDLSENIASFARDRKLPSISIVPDYARLGGLMGYGVPSRDLFTKAAYFLKRILDGANAGDLPVEQPTRVELVVNLKIAKVLGVDVPATMVTRADEVID